ncbi:MAG: Tex-like N-terminal domain-containing protein, partial [Flavobacteriales bacterium]
MQHKIIAQQNHLSEKQVSSVIQLLEGGATIPFIARYRKESTGSLDEVKIAEIKSQYDASIELEKRRASIIKTIEQQGQLTPELQAKLNSVSNAQALEDLYLPYKQKRKTRAAAAIEKGLEPLAKIIFAQNGANIDRYSEEELAGARDIIAEWVNENLSVRNTIRRTFEREAILYAKVKKGKEADAIKYRDYFFFREELKKIPSHRLLAIKRGQEEGFLKAYIAINNE